MINIIFGDNGDCAETQACIDNFTYLVPRSLCTLVLLFKYYLKCTKQLSKLSTKYENFD